MLEARGDTSASNALFSAGYGIGPTNSATTGATSWNGLSAALALLERARPARDHRDERVAVTILRDERQRRGDLERGERAELLRRVRDVLAEEPQDVLRLAQLEEHRPAVDVLHRDAAGTRTRSPRRSSRRRLGAPRRGRRSRARSRRRNRPSAVTTSAETRLSSERPNPRVQIADAAAERQTGDAGRRDDPAGRRQPERVGGGVEVAPRGPALGASRRGIRIDPDASHPGEVDHDAAVDTSRTPARCGRPPRTARSSPFSRAKVTAAITSPAFCGPDDHGRPPVDHRVVDGARLARSPRRPGTITRPRDLLSELVRSSLRSWFLLPVRTDRPCERT